MRKATLPVSWAEMRRPGKEEGQRSTRATRRTVKGASPDPITRITKGRDEGLPSIDRTGAERPR